jgi:hypothetical protein
MPKPKQIHNIMIYIGLFIPEEYVINSGNTQAAKVFRYQLPRQTPTILVSYR